MVTKLDTIKDYVDLAQKAFDRFPNETGITIVSKLLKQILRVINE